MAISLRKNVLATSLGVLVIVMLPIGLWIARARSYVQPIAYRPVVLPSTAGIFTSQLGFTPGDDKFAVLAVAPSATVEHSFQVVDTASGRTVFDSKPGDVRYFGEGWKGSNDTGDTYVLDLSGWNAAPGRYRVESNGLASYPFRVGEDVYDIRQMDPLNFFNTQRSGVAVAWKSLNGTSGRHKPDFLDDARAGEIGDAGGGDPLLLEQPPLFAPGQQIDVRGGWFDAGDYNKYMGNAPWAVYNVLLAYEDAPAYWDKLDHDRNGSSDLLDAAVPPLEWMLKMMHPDGSVYERVYDKQNLSFDGRPDQETDNLFGTLDDRPLDTDRWADVTAKSSYAMAAASRIFKASDDNASARYLDMARRTWDWAEQNQTIVKAKKYGGGLYFGDVENGLALGAIELYWATGEQRYLDFASKLVADHLKAGDWAEPSGWDYQRSNTLQRFYPYASKEQQGIIVQQLGDRIERGIAQQANNPYRVNGEFLDRGFGMNDVTASHAVDALWLFQQTGKPEYYRYALNQMQWIWGRNPFGKSWLASELVSDYPAVIHSRVTNQHPIGGVVVPGAVDFDENGLPDYADVDFWAYTEATINQQAVYTRAVTNLYAASHAAGK
ncbi:MAG: glycoside hydrolase family 9 protein [Chloroflexi bacterium]|nr:glycoside hydrolase family 9 protein [Chloroflexota bacterium]